MNNNVSSIIKAELQRHLDDPTDSNKTYLVIFFKANHTLIQCSFTISSFCHDKILSSYSYGEYCY